MRLVPFVVTAAVLCAACTDTPAGDRAGDPAETYASQIDVPAPDHAALLEQNLLDRNPGEIWEADRAALQNPPENAREIGEIWIERLRARDLLAGAMGAEDGRWLRFDVGTTADDFRALIEAEGWSVPDFIAFSMQGALNLPPVSKDAQGAARIWPASSTRTGMQNMALHYGRIVLRDGCFFVSDEDGVPDKLAFFLAETGLDRDDEGYLIFVDRMTGATLMRVGEAANWAGPASTVVSDEMRAQLREQCGEAEIRIVGMPTAQALFEMQYPRGETPTGKVPAD